MALELAMGSYIETPFHDHKDHTLHIRIGIDSRGRRVELKEKWKSQKKIHFGDLSTLYLQEEVPTRAWFSKPAKLAKSAKLRVVKEMEKGRIANKIDYKREIIALMEFSQNKFTYRDTFVQFLGWFDDVERVNIAMEYLPIGSLDRYIPSAIPEDDARQISAQILKGLQYMHEAGYTHRDVKPENILLVTKRPESSIWHVKLADFGGSKRVIDKNTNLRTVIGTIPYQAPEFSPDFLENLKGYDAQKDSQTSALDLWSLGCVVYHIMALRPPFPGSPLFYCRENGKDFPDGPFSEGPGARTSPTCIDFIKRILRPLPSERPTAKMALEDKWFPDLTPLLPLFVEAAASESSLSPYRTSLSSEKSNLSLGSSSSSVAKLVPDVPNPNPNLPQPAKYNQLTHTRPPRNQYLHRRPPDSR